MKKAVLLYFIVFSLSPVVSSGSLKKISVKDFTISVPADWSVSEKTPPHLLSGHSSGYEIMVDVMVEKLDKDYTYEEFYVHSLESLKKSMDINVLEKKGNYHIFNAKMMGTEVKQLQAYFIKGKKAYILGLSGSPEDFNKFKTAVFSIKDSFKLR